MERKSRFDSMSPIQRLNHLDGRLGRERGAIKERQKWVSLLSKYIFDKEQLKVADRKLLTPGEYPATVTTPKPTDTMEDCVVSRMVAYDIEKVKSEAMQRVKFVIPTTGKLKKAAKL